MKIVIVNLWSDDYNIIGTTENNIYYYYYSRFYTEHTSVPLLPIQSAVYRLRGFLI